MKISWIILSIGSVVFLVCMMGCSGKPRATGIVNGKLASCPASPNCVSSMTEDVAHFVEPFVYQGEREKAFTILRDIVSQSQRAKIQEERDNYIWAEFRSQIMGFVDDVEFFLPADRPVIHVRSASRVGYSDLGVNRKRIEELRKRFQEQIENQASDK